jgi:ATP-dependent DNA helicase RecG
LDRIERTLSTNDTDKFAKAITAFANDLSVNRKPGYLLIGVDNDGVPGGLSVTDALLLNLAALRSDGNIQPLPAINVAKFDLRAGQVAVVEVFLQTCHRFGIRGRFGSGSDLGVESQMNKKSVCLLKSE